MMKRLILGAIYLAAMLAAAQTAFAADNVQKACIITARGNETPLIVPVPRWASRELCEQMRDALPGPNGKDVKLGCMVGPNEADFAPESFHVVGPNRGNPCHWPFVTD